MKGVPLPEQIVVLRDHLLRRTVTSPSDSELDGILDWIRDITPAARPPDIVKLVKEKFGLDDETLELRLSPTQKQTDFEALVPPDGWLRDYIEYTRKTEPPTVFHFFVGMVTLGAAMQRNLYVRKGHYNVYPNLCVVIVAPTGKCRKTSACNIGVELVRGFGGNVIADKSTPEALVEAFREREQAVGLLYAPELAVFLGKQRYQEGMIPMLTSLFDAPKEWSSLTIGRGELKLTNVALSFLGASTMDWIQSAIPRDMFGGGFMSRILFVVQEDTPRKFAIPPPPSDEMRAKLRKGLIALTQRRGELLMSDEVTGWYDSWYNGQQNGHEERQFAGYSERKPDHLLRVATILSASEVASMVEVRHLERGLRILEWMERSLPKAFEQMGQTAIGEDHTKMLRQLRGRGGAIDHSTWLRLNSGRMDSRVFRERVDTLRQARLIEFEPKTRQYLLTPEGWKQ